MSFKLPTINKNILFTPTLLIFLLLVALQLNSLPLLSREFIYSNVFAAAVFVIFIRIFLTSFRFIEDSFSKQKPIPLVLNIILTAVEATTTYLAIVYLANDTYANETIWWLSLTQLGFLVSQILATRQLPRVSAFNLAIYALLSLVFYLEPFNTNPDQLLLFQQSSAWLVLGLELFLLLITAHKFFDK
jgi:hypothetical protein